MTEIYSKLAEIIKNRQKAALCVITETKGSTPRKLGSKMIVMNNKTVFGSVGGGALEHFVVDKAIEIISSQQPEMLSFGLKTDFEMACGGNVKIYIEPVMLPYQLIIFGAGHIGKALATFAQHLDFQIIIIDNRKDIFNTWENKNFTFLNENFEDAIKKLKFDKQTFVVSATYAHSFDKEIAGIIGAKETAYLGVIASKNKAKKIKDHLINNKILTSQQANKIDMPSGIPIACETPEEIAISLLAKIIDIRNSL